MSLLGFRKGVMEANTKMINCFTLLVQYWPKVTHGWSRALPTRYKWETSAIQRGPKVTSLVAHNVCKGSAVVTRSRCAVLTQMIHKCSANVAQTFCKCFANVLQIFCKYNADMFNSSTRGIMKINKPTWWLILLINTKACVRTWWIHKMLHAQIVPVDACVKLSWCYNSTCMQTAVYFGC
jgi:hypothetical protein